MKDGNELTRMYLLNSHSRGWADEVEPEQQGTAGEEGPASFVQNEWNADEGGSGSNLWEEESYASSEEGAPSSGMVNSFMAEWDGRQETHAMFRRSYE